MELTKVTYSRTRHINLNDTENIAISADIDIQEDASEVLAYLQNWVETKLKVRETVAKLDVRKNELQTDVYRLEKELIQAKERWQKAQAFMEKVGLSNIEDIPF